MHPIRAILLDLDGTLVDSQPGIMASCRVALHTLGHALAPAACVMVGDRRYDIAGAHANGMRGLGVLWGYGTRAELEAVGADGLVAEPAALSGIAFGMVNRSAD